VRIAWLDDRNGFDSGGDGPSAHCPPPQASCEPKTPPSASDLVTGVAVNVCYRQNLATHTQVRAAIRFRSLETLLAGEDGPRAGLAALAR
jgi:hypothetical protein